MQDSEGSSAEAPDGILHNESIDDEEAVAEGLGC
jgi:hypothetical protein